MNATRGNLGTDGSGVNRRGREKRRGRNEAAEVKPWGSVMKSVFASRESQASGWTLPSLSVEGAADLMRGAFEVFDSLYGSGRSRAGRRSLKTPRER
jgi:hypothetical protein